MVETVCKPSRTEAGREKPSKAAVECRNMNPHFFAYKAPEIFSCSLESTATLILLGSQVHGQGGGISSGTSGDAQSMDTPVSQMAWY